MLLAEERLKLGLPIIDLERLDRIRVILLGWSAIMWWAILPSRRQESWWTGEVRRHVQGLVDLDR